MYSLQLFDPLTANSEEFKALYKYRLKKAQRDCESFDKSLEDFSNDLRTFYESSTINYTIYKVIEGEDIIGTIEHYTNNKGKKEEILIIEFKLLHKFKDDYWTNFQLEKHINNWTKNVLKSKIEAEEEVLVNLLKQAGWRKSNIKVDLKVNIEKLNKALLEEYILKGNPKKNNLKVEILLSPTRMEFEEISPLFTDLLNDMVRTDMSHVFLITPEELVEIQKLNEARGNLIHRIILRDSTNNIIGISINKVAKDNPKTLWQYMAGVLPKYRNKGLTTWMKSYAYQKLLREFPTIKEIKTDCYIDNKAIIHINKKMGFEIDKVTTDMFFEKQEG